MLLEIKMLSKNETFKPPEIHEEWANNQFANILDYMSEKKISFNGAIFLQWLAVPYISIWNAPSTKVQGDTIWVMHNLEFTDYIISSEIQTPRKAITEFSKKWESGNIETLRVRNNNLSKLDANSIMLFNVGNDHELWEA